ncbi:MAG: aldehyde ferredoxin oxidoreductase C-terminal domain-containing protein [Candidatus Bathyarchaeia archaeon]
MRGYAGKFSEIDLSTGSIKDVRLPEEMLRSYLGGRGLATKILWDRLGERWETIDPLSPENILLVLAGPLTGYYPGGRMCISGKSPLTLGIVGSTIAGEHAVDMRCAGYDGLIINGRAEKPVYIFVTDDNVEIKDASHVWGKDRVETYKILTKEGTEALEKKAPGIREWREPSILHIGPLGERMGRIAAVQTKFAHGAGYGGYGGVMGSKNLKAILFKGIGPLPEPYDMEKTKELIWRIAEINFRADSMRRWGTGAAGYDVGARTSSEPVRNWQEEWHDEKGFGVDKFEERVWVKRYWGDFGCPTTCEKLSVVKAGPYKGSISDNPDYEIQAYGGTNLGIFTPEGNVKICSVMEDLGFCGIQGGNVLGFAAELYQRGLLTESDLGFPLEWGDVDAFVKLMKMIAEREGIGDILAEGTYRAAVKLSKLKGEDLLKYAVVEKGEAIGAHGIRSRQDYVEEVSYPCSVQGGDHTSPAQRDLRKGDSELTAMLHDCGVYCWFNINEEAARALIWDFLQAVTGWPITADEWYNNMALRILAIQRAVLLLGGPDFTWKPLLDDDIPPRWYEPLPSGPYKGRASERGEVLKDVQRYFNDVGWDDQGIPKSSELKRLGLDDVDFKLKSFFGNL